MDIDWITLSPYEKRRHMKENKCFMCHKLGCHPWKHSRKREEAGENLWATGLTEKERPSQESSPTSVTTLVRSITILVELYYTENRKILKTSALIDSGATISCIDHHLINQMKWPLNKLYRPMNAQKMDRTETAGGTIQHQVTLQLRIQGRTSTETFYMLNMGGQDNIILGYPWLNWNNLQIDWTTGEVHMIGTPTP